VSSVGVQAVHYDGWWFLLMNASSGVGGCAAKVSSDRLGLYPKVWDVVWCVAVLTSKCGHHCQQCSLWFDYHHRNLLLRLP